MNVAKFLYVLCAVLALLSCSDEERFTIEGELGYTNAKTAYLVFVDEVFGNEVLLDSSKVNDGKFRFSGKVESPVVCQIRVGRRNSVKLFVENSDIKVHSSAHLPDEVVVTGSKADADLDVLQKKERELLSEKNMVWLEIVNAKKAKKYRRAEELKRRYDRINDSLFVFTRDFVYVNPKSVGASYFIYYLMLTQKFDSKKLEPVVSLFDPSISETYYMKYIKEEMLLNQRLALNMEAYDFCLPLQNGATVSLSDFKGKYVYLDFTATWCRSCMSQRNDLKRIYDKYHDSGLEIVSVYLDKNKEEWAKSVEASALPWSQVCDFKYWESPVTKYYRVHKIPYGVLIDGDGKLVAINPSFRMLEAKLKKENRRKNEF